VVKIENQDLKSLITPTVSLYCLSSFSIVDSSIIFAIITFYREKSDEFVVIFLGFGGAKTGEVMSFKEKGFKTFGEFIITSCSSCMRRGCGFFIHGLLFIK
jgi:hypothetical protein